MTTPQGESAAVRKPISLPHGPPGLLVSIRNPAEATLVRDLDIDLVDIKEPQAGPLGSATLETIAQIDQVLTGSKPISIAGGELADYVPATMSELPAGAGFLKLGPAGIGQARDWLRLWERLTSYFSEVPWVTRVAVAYADWDACGAPDPLDLASAAIDGGFQIFLIDTSEKQGHNLFDHISPDQVGRLIERLSDHHVETVLAGSLRGDSLTRAIELRPAMVGVRGAVCPGSREGTISVPAVEAVCEQIRIAREC